MPINLNQELTEEQTQEILKAEGAFWFKHAPSSRYQLGEITGKAQQRPSKLRSLYAMESTGGEPDVLRYDYATNEFVFMTARPKLLKADVVYAMTEKFGCPKRI